MKRLALHILLALLFPASLVLTAAAQEGGGSGPGGDTSAVEDGSKEAAADTTPSGNEGTAALDRGETAVRKTEKQAERKKKPARKPAAEEAKQKEEPAEEVADDGIGDRLLLVDHEKIRYNRIPGITIQDDEAGGDAIVNVPDEKLGGAEKASEKESTGIFGKNTRAIAGWGIVILIFILFVIYSKTRSRKSKRRVVRTVPKR